MDKKKKISSLESKVRTIFLILCALVSIFFGVIGGVIFSYIRDLPAIEKLREYEPDKVAQLYSANGELFAEFYIKRRMIVDFKDIPQSLKNAIIAVEDSNFYNHFGIDIKGITRAAISNLFAGRVTQGGSTITQQLSKVLFLTPERKLSRKIKEALIAFQIEREFTKDEILELYLNQLYFGSGAYGVETASFVYFNKHVKDLTTEEAALLAGLPKAPSRYSPYNNIELARQRRNYVLKRMFEEKMISREEYEKLIKTPIKLNPGLSKVSKAPYFSEYVRRYIENKFGTKALYKEGLKIKTTLDLKLQDYARKALNRGLMEYSRRKPFSKVPEDKKDEYISAFSDVEKLEKDITYCAKIKEVENNGTIEVSIGKVSGYIPPSSMKWAKIDNPQSFFTPGDCVFVSLKSISKDGNYILNLENYDEVNGAIVVVENSTGHIKAMVGGRNFLLSQFNRAFQAKRQPGSAFKPFIYTAAIESRKINALTKILDLPFTSELPDGTLWKPENYDGKFKGLITVQQALQESRNLATIRLLQKVGTKPVISVAHKMGIKENLEPYLSLALGSESVPLLDITSAYTVFPNLGIKIKPTAVISIENNRGEVIEKAIEEKKQVISPETAYTMTNLLSFVVSRGTARRTRIKGIPSAGKTGTTNEFKDAWFIGFTPEFTAGVYIGYDDNSISLGKRQTGGGVAGPVWKYFAQNFYKDRKPGSFKKPANVLLINVNPKTGEPLKNREPGSIEIAFIKGTEPSAQEYKRAKAIDELREKIYDEGL